MKQFLVVVDMQKDFVDGSLGTPEAQAIVSRAAEKIRSFEGDIFERPSSSANATPLSTVSASSSRTLKT